MIPMNKAVLVVAFGLVSTMSGIFAANELANGDDVADSHDGFIEQVITKEESPTRRLNPHDMPEWTPGRDRLIKAACKLAADNAFQTCVKSIINHPDFGDCDQTPVRQGCERAREVTYDQCMQGKGVPVP